MNCNTCLYEPKDKNFYHKEVPELCKKCENKGELVLDALLLRLKEKNNET